VESVAWIRRLLRWAKFALIALGLIVLVVTATPLVGWWSTLLAGKWTDPRGEVLIVLGGGAIDGEVLALSSHWRCIYAWRAWKEGTFRKVVVSGKDVAPLMRDFLVAQGVPATAIVVENSSVSTRENALAAKALLAGEPGTVVLLTSDYHMFRAHAAFAKAGLKVLPRPFPDGRKRVYAPSQRWGVFMDLATETVKLAYYWVRGWI
jgi:uncharacterized SAM-binding protein YcdF (DUF218 family)